MVFGILLVVVIGFIIFQSVISYQSNSNHSRIKRNGNRDTADMSFMAASHPDLLDTNNPHHFHHHHHHGGDSHHHSGNNDCGHSWGGDSGHSGGGDSGGGDAGGGGCD